MLLNIGLRPALADYAKRHKTISREKLRNYGCSLKTVKAPYGYDIDNVSRRIRELQQSGCLIGLNRRKQVAVGNEYITHFRAS